MADNRYCVEYAKRGTAGCKKCKQKIDKGAVRIGKIVPNPFTDGQGEMKMWFHVPCMFEQLSRARATTKKIESADDLEGWEDLEKEDKDDILNYIRSLPSASKQATSTAKKHVSPANMKAKEATVIKGTALKSNFQSTKDDCFKEFRRLCNNVANEPSYNNKTKIMEDFFKYGTSGDGFQGDLFLWVKMLLPAISKRIYNLQSKQLVKLFSQIFGTDHDEMLADLEKGDVAETIRIFFEESNVCIPVKRSTLTLQEVDSMLEDLSLETKEEEQMRVLSRIVKRCTSNDLKMIVRLIKHDLRISAGPKHVLDALHPEAYQAFQASRDLQGVMERILGQDSSASQNSSLAARASLMTPVLPMLAEPCRSIDYAFKKCPNGIYAEVKYDGERVQVHKMGSVFKYFSRSLKPVLEHKVAHLKDYIPKAFPYGNDLILDSEVLLIDTNTGKPLPFGTLGVHKKAAFKDASVCLFVFDCIHYNNESLMNKPLKERRKILCDNMTVIPNHIVISEMKLVKKKKELRDLIVSTIRLGLEGLVLKDAKSVYEPGKRHWLKVKKDYLEEGTMADTADLVVLGAYFGTGNKGGMMSIFLMGCYDSYSQKWCTVTKVHGGHDDATLDRLQTELDMVKIKKDPSKVPPWLKVNKSLIPDFVCRDPKESQVWEITGAEFTRAEAHTAKGISIRFPRVTRIRHDKNWKTATNLQELQKLFEKSSETWDLPPEDDNDNCLAVAIGDSSEDNILGANCQKEEMHLWKEGSSKRKTMFHSDSANTSSSSSALSSESIPSSTTKEEPASKKSKTSYREHEQSSTTSPKCVFPSVFQGIRVVIPETVENWDLLRRYVIAYDGEVLNFSDTHQATHVVIDEKTKHKTDKIANILQVTPDWLWDSIKLQRLRSTRLYSPGK